ncbi:MAG: hypothetical protein MZU97_25825 [Bacillus subtilis]|nr:hypothetical protein [Bacillus subtilis]
MVKTVPTEATAEIALQIIDGYIQWQYVGDDSWTPLISIPDGPIGPQGEPGIAGSDGRELLLQVSDGYIQWQYVGDETWNNH